MSDEIETLKAEIVKLKVKQKARKHGKIFDIDFEHPCGEFEMAIKKMVKSFLEDAVTSISKTIDKL